MAGRHGVRARRETCAAHRDSSAIIWKRAAERSNNESRTGPGCAATSSCDGELHPAWATLAGCSMTFLEAAIAVLRSSRQPLTTREVTERALEAGLIDTHGKTPNATMAAVLYRALHTDGELIKIDGPGNGRAKRGSVRWAAQKTGAKVTRAAQAAPP